MLTLWDVFSLMSHQFELWDGSAQAPLLAVGKMYWRETETTISQKHDEVIQTTSRLLLLLLIIIIMIIIITIIITSP